MNQPRFQESIIRSLTKDAVIREYTESSALATDSEKARWGSEESMLNRFRLGVSLIEWTGVRRWLDVGCGTGRFFNVAEEEGHRFDELIGVDITEAIIAQARERTFQSPARFEISDMGTMPEDIADMDLLTLVGVLQQCGDPLEDAVAACVGRLKPDGQIFLTTKHLGWSAFEDGGLDPEPGHSWFLFDDVKRAVENGEIKILRSGGYLPREGKIVEPEDSHTLFLWGKRA